MAKRGKKKFCPKCGTESDIDDKFCIKCGYSFSKKKKKKIKPKTILIAVAFLIIIWIILRVINKKPVFPEPLISALKNIFNSTR